MRIDHHCALCGQRLPDQQVQIPSIGRAVVLARTEAGLNQRALSQRSGVSPSFLCDVEQGRRNPSYETLARIAGVCGLQVSQLCAMAEGGNDTNN